MIVEIAQQVAFNWNLVGYKTNVVIQLVMRRDNRSQTKLIELRPTRTPEDLIKTIVKEMD